MALIPHFDIPQLVQTLGYFGVFAFVFAESGFFIGFFLPGDTLLFTAGLLASQGFLNIWIMIFLIILGAILGDSFGYWFGKKVGPKIFSREDSLLFHKSHVERTHQFYVKYGAKAVVLARFIPVVRTFTPILAGVGGMPYKTFLQYNIVGGILWGGGVTLIGYFLGAVIPGIDGYIIPILFLIIVISFTPVIREFMKSKNG